MNIQISDCLSFLQIADFLFSFRAGSEDSSSVKLVQSGFVKKVTGVQGRAETVTLKHSSGSSHQLQVSAGATTVCLPKSGDFELEVGAAACQRPVSTSVSSTSATPLDLAPVKRAVIIKATGVPRGDVTFKITAGGKTAEVHAKREDGDAVGSYWGDDVASLTVTPLSSDASVIFTPSTTTYKVGTRGAGACPAASVTFAASVGITMSGSVIPAMSGVAIIASSASGAEAARIVTGADGTYSLGPLDGEGYTLRAEKTNFQFVKEGGDFRSVQLGHVTLRTVDTGGKAVAGVLLSLSGDAGFRHNNKTAEDGTYTFADLLPGDYFLRPNHKEFKFEPNSLTLTVAEGPNPAVTLKGSRVAFSATGTVRLLDGNPEKSCVMVARALDGSSASEEGTSDAGGEFRIRGLKPGVRYAISVKTGSDSTRHERGSPASVTITMGNSDYAEGLSFMAFRKHKVLDLAGTVEVEAEARVDQGNVLKSIAIELLAASNPGMHLAIGPLSPRNQSLLTVTHTAIGLFSLRNRSLLTSTHTSGVVLRTVPLSAASYFEFNDLARGEYLLRATSSLDSRAFRISSAPVRVALQDSLLPVVVPFKAELRGGSEAVATSNFLFLVMAVVTAYVFANRHEMFPTSVSKPDAATASQFEGNMPPQTKKDKASKKAN